MKVKFGPSKNYKNSGCMFAGTGRIEKKRLDEKKQRICKNCKNWSPIEDPCGCNAGYYYK